MNNLFISKKSIIFVLKTTHIKYKVRFKFKPTLNQDDNHYIHTHNHFLNCCSTNHLEDYHLYNQCVIYNYLFYN